MRLGVCVLLSLLLAMPGAAHTGGAYWPLTKVMRKVDGKRIPVGTRTVRIDADTTLCSGEGRRIVRRGMRTWTHFRCTFTTFTPRGVGPDVEFRAHALDANRMAFTDARWIR